MLTSPPGLCGRDGLGRRRGVLGLGQRDRRSHGQAEAQNEQQAGCGASRGAGEQRGRHRDRSRERDDDAVGERRIERTGPTNPRLYMGTDGPRAARRVRPARRRASGGARRPVRRSSASPGGRRRALRPAAGQAARHRHPAGEEDPDAVLHRQVRDRSRRSAGDTRCRPDRGDWSARRRPPASRPGPRSSVNSRVRNPSTNPRPRILHQHHPLEPGLVVGRERRHQLLDRRIDGLEDRHAGAGSPRRAAAARLPTTLVATAPTTSTHQGGGEQAEARHLAPEPPLTTAGRSTPSTTRNIQTSAARLTTSGTVTKNPVMKLRRSHCITRPSGARCAPRARPRPPRRARAGTRRRRRAGGWRGSGGRTRSSCSRRPPTRPCR